MNREVATLFFFSAMVLVSSFLFRNKLDDTLVMKESIAKVVTSLSAGSSGTQTRQSLSPRSIAKQMIAMSDKNGDKQLDVDEITRFYTEFTGMDQTTAETISSTFMQLGDKDNNDKLSRTELTKIFKDYGF